MISLRSLFSKEKENMATSRSASVIDRLNRVFDRFNVGSRLYRLTEAAREMHDAFAAAGALGVLVNELRTRLVTSGDMFEMIVDLSDACYNKILTDPGLQEDAGVATDLENANQVDGIVNGIYAAAIIAAGAMNLTPTAGWDTGVGETRLVTIATDVGGTVSQTPSALDATVPPRPPSGEMAIGIVAVPASWTAGVSHVGLCAFTDGWPRRLAVPVTVAAAALTDLSATKPDVLPDTY